MKRLVILALLVAGCVAPAQAGGNCAVTAHAVQLSTGRQIDVQGSGFADNDQVTIDGSAPYGSLDVELAANADGIFDVQVRGDVDGTYTIGPATGLACRAPAVVLTLTTPKPTPKPTVQPTIPPTPNITLPPTDTDP